MSVLPSPQRPSPPPILDIEASGFGLGSYPIEVGLVMCDGRSWCSLVKPEPSWQHWDPNAEAVHKITREQLDLHGRHAKDIARVLNDWLHGLVVYSDAWAHDYTWLNKLYEVAELVPSFRLENLRALLTDDEAARWHELKLAVARRAAIVRHRASSDAKLLQMTLQALREPQHSISSVV
ncbi:MAG TPA: hypothetical protein VFW84_04755 [Aquabacterium sp.]|uniref:3'-5' exonuclease n=1 Tax=Aquabacterium sp. TaxID=1872578 RepID=UPI002E36455A|nr:hypothetical protein [Aquabacterium sp.]HEX5372023.1 hypothetical protein [Aquabacterium sp.]